MLFQLLAERVVVLGQLRLVGFERGTNLLLHLHGLLVNQLRSHRFPPVDVVQMLLKVQLPERRFLDVGVPLQQLLQSAGRLFAMLDEVLEAEEILAADAVGDA